jgi:PEGA domain
MTSSEKSNSSGLRKLSAHPVSGSTGNTSGIHELKGSKQVLLMPGEHEIMVRQGGYLDFVEKVSVRAGEKQVINVKMEKDSRVQMPRVTAEIKLDVTPNRAAVFVDGIFVGHVAEFGGIGRALLVEPGKRKVIISLPGWRGRGHLATMRLDGG